MGKQNTKRAALYIRVASADQFSAENQKEKLLRYAEEQGITKFNVYLDNGYSGLNSERPAFKHMITDIENGKINLVMATGISRIYRDYFQAFGFVQTLKNNDVGIDTIDKSHTAIETMNPDIIMEAIKKNIDKDISSRIRAGMRLSAERKKNAGILENDKSDR